MKSKPPGISELATEGRFAYEGLDRVIHERARLSVLTSLLTNPKGLTFGDLKQLCALTDGNLSRHLSVLEKAKMVEILKGHDRNRPQTICRITADGRKRYLEYLSTLEQVVKDAAKGTKEEPASTSIRGLTLREARTPFFVHLLCIAKLFWNRERTNERYSNVAIQLTSQIEDPIHGYETRRCLCVGSRDDHPCALCRRIS